MKKLFLFLLLLAAVVKYFGQDVKKIKNGVAITTVKQTNKWTDFSRTNKDAAGNKYSVRNDQRTPDSINFTLIKTSASGRCLWKMNVPGAYSNSMITGKSGEVYMAGLVHDTVVLGAHTLAPVAGFTSTFICKINPDGSIAWAKQQIGKGYFDLTSINSDFSDNIYVGGRFGYMAILGDSAQLTSQVSNTYFISAYDTQGDLKWAKQADASFNTAAEPMDKSELYTEKVQVMPISTQGDFMIQMDEPEANTGVCIYDESGKCVYKGKHKNAKNIQVNASDLPKGTYLIELNSENDSLMRKTFVLE